MNRVTSLIAIVFAIGLLPATVFAEPQVATAPVESPGAGVTATAEPITAPGNPAGTREKQQESEPEWPQPRCEAPAE